MDVGLIVGLGNPGKEYEQTRHNFGFMAVDALVDSVEKNVAVTTLSGKKDPFILQKANFGIAMGTWFFAKPLTFMNRSGLAVQHIASYYRIELNNILVIHDELDLPLGKMKFKLGGGNAGHNGLKSIQEMMGSGEFYRLRLGISAPKGFETVSYVLGGFSSAEKQIMDKILPEACEVAKLFMQGERAKAQLRCNSFKLAEV